MPKINSLGIILFAKSFNLSDLHDFDLKGQDHIYLCVCVCVCVCMCVTAFSVYQEIYIFDGLLRKSIFEEDSCNK